MTTRCAGQVIQVKDRLVRHRVRFQMAPDVFHGIQLRRIGGQGLRPPASLRQEILVDAPGPVSREAIP